MIWPGSSVKVTSSAHRVITRCALAPWLSAPERPVSLTATIGGVGPGRGQERDMVIGVRVRDAKADGYLVQEQDCSVRPPDRREIVAQAKDEFVDPGTQCIPGQEGSIGSALGIRAHDLQPLSCVALGVDSIELNRHSSGRSAMD